MVTSFSHHFSNVSAYIDLIQIQYVQNMTFGAFRQRKNDIRDPLADILSHDPAPLPDSCSRSCKCKTIQVCYRHPKPCNIDISFEWNHTHIEYNTRTGSLMVCISPKCVSEYLGVICYQCFLEKQAGPKTPREQIVWKWRGTTMEIPVQ